MNLDRSHVALFVMYSKTDRGRGSRAGTGSLRPIAVVALEVASGYGVLAAATIRRGVSADKQIPDNVLTERRAMVMA